jgi:hypothetical protein
LGTFLFLLERQLWLEFWKIWQEWFVWMGLLWKLGLWIFLELRQVWKEWFVWMGQQF